MTFPKIKFQLDSGMLNCCGLAMIYSFELDRGRTDWGFGGRKATRIEPTLFQTQEEQLKDFNTRFHDWLSERRDNFLVDQEIDDEDDEDGFERRPYHSVHATLIKSPLPQIGGLIEFMKNNGWSEETFVNPRTLNTISYLKYVL